MSTQDKTISSELNQNQKSLKRADVEGVLSAAPQGLGSMPPSVGPADAGLDVDHSNHANADSETENACLNNVISGALLSNTAPANCINIPGPGNNYDFSVLRLGIDSLYLSYPGKLGAGWAQRLEGLKLAAQSTEEGDRSNAQVKLGGHLFEVKDKGKGRFAFVLVDNCYHIQLSSGQSDVLPLAYVQLSSELLTALSIREAEEKLRFIVNTLGIVRSEAQVSRVDLFVDFVSPMTMDSWKQNAWVTRANKI